MTKPGKNKPAMTPKQQRFVEEYLVDLNATQAAIRAGFSKKTAEVQGPRLLGNVRVRDAIDQAKTERSQRVLITADEVLLELKKMGFSNMLDYITVQEGEAYVDLSKLTRDQAAAIQEVTVDTYMDGGGEDAKQVKRIKFKLADKRASLQLLGEHLKLFTQVHEHRGLGQLADRLKAAHERTAGR